ncbi:MAG: right-handed parallel beta-helix repeat-containing protein, partial [Pseudomonadota bacterium]
YEIQKQLKQNPIYQWVEAIDTHQGHPVMLQIFQPKLPPEAQSAILAYFDDLQTIRRQPIWSPIQSFSNTDSSLIFAYPFLHTTSLLQVLRQATKEEALKWWQQASEALHILHNANLVHGYVTLDSFVIAEQDLYLTDFGYAPLLQLGYPNAINPHENFLAPEVVEKKQLTPASDIYAFAKAVKKFYPQLTDTSWYSQATHPNPDNRFQRIRPCFAELEKAFPSVNSIIVPKYLLETRVEPPESGKIVKNNTSFLADKVATVLAKPASGWQFDHWSGDINGVNNPLKLKIDGDKTLVANFKKVPLTPEIIVDSSGSGYSHYKTISEAIKNAQPNTRIRVRPGVYKESIVIDKPVKIIGKGSVKDIVIESIESSCILMQTDQATVKGLTLRCQVESEEPKYSAVDIPQGQLILENCDITSDSFVCINIYGSQSNPVIRNCRIHDGNSGIFISDKAQGIVEDCDIFSNSVGIGIVQESNPIVRRCRIHDGESMGVIISGNGRGLIENCSIFANNLGIGIANNLEIGIKNGNNILISHCQIYENDELGVCLEESSQVTLEKSNIFANNNSGISIKNESNILISHCHIYDNDNFGVGLHENSQATIENSNIFANNNCGIASRSKNNILVQYSQIYENQCGIIVEEINKITVEECNIFSNEFGGILATGNNLLIRNSQIHGHNNYYAIGLGGYWNMTGKIDQGIIENTDIFSNAIGVAIQAGSNIIIRNCQIHDNSYTDENSESESYGIAISENSQVIIENSDIFSNETGVIISTGSNTVISRCQIYDHLYEPHFENEGEINLDDELETIMMEADKIAKRIGVVTVENSQITLEDCELFANWKGLYTSEDSNAIVSNCHIDDLET